jgi:hypothetical protein
MKLTWDAIVVTRGLAVKRKEESAREDQEMEMEMTNLHTAKCALNISARGYLAHFLGSRCPNAVPADRIFEWKLSDTRLDGRR